MTNNPFGLGGKPNFNFGPQPSKPELDQYYTVAAVARSLSVSESTVKKWIASGELEAYRYGKRSIRVPAEALTKMRKKVQGGEK